MAAVACACLKSDLFRKNLGVACSMFWFRLVLVCVCVLHDSMFFRLCYALLSLLLSMCFIAKCSR